MHRTAQQTPAMFAQQLVLNKDGVTLLGLEQEETRPAMSICVGVCLYQGNSGTSLG